MYEKPTTSRRERRGTFIFVDSDDVEICEGKGDFF